MADDSPESGMPPMSSMRLFEWKLLPRYGKLYSTGHVNSLQTHGGEEFHCKILRISIDSTTQSKREPHRHPRLKLRSSEGCKQIGEIFQTSPEVTRQCYCIRHLPQHILHVVRYPTNVVCPVVKSINVHELEQHFRNAPNVSSQDGRQKLFDDWSPKRSRINLLLYNIGSAGVR
jgi:hypothetical protein